MPVPGEGRAGAGSGARGRAARWPAWLGLLLLAGGVAGFARQELRGLRSDMWPYATTPFFVLLGPDDVKAALVAPADLAGLALDAQGPLQALALDEDDGACHHVERIGAQVILEVGSVLELRLRDTQTTSVRLRLRPDDGAGATLEVLHGAGATDAVSAQELPRGRVVPGCVAQLAAVVRDNQVEVELDDWCAAPVQLGPPGGGGTSLRAAGGRLLLSSLTVTGLKTDMLGKLKPFSHQATWRAPNAAERRAVVLDVLGAAGAGCLALAWWHAAVGCARRGFARLAAATSVSAGAAAVGGWGGLLLDDATAAPGLAAGLLVLAVLLPLASLPIARSYLGRPGPDATPRGATSAARAILAAGLLAGATGWVLASERWDFVQARRLREDAAAAQPAPDEVVRAGPLALDLGNAFSAEATYRDLDLRARITLSEDAILGVRLRGSGLDVAHGVLLLLSADGRLASGFWREDVLAFEPLGPPGLTCPAGRELNLQVTARGRDFAAILDGTPFARAEHDDLPSGAVVLLALRGSVRVDDLVLAGRAAEPVPPPALLREARAWLVPLLAPMAALLAFALLAARLMRLRLLDVLEPSACAFIPFLLVSAAGREEGLLLAGDLRWAGFAAVVLLFLVVVLRAPRGAAGRATAALALALVGVPLAMRISIDDELVRGDAETLRAHHLIWSGPRQEEDLLHLTHPRFRLQNGWLARHRLRSGEHALEPPAGTRRVMFLGASCTWGFRMPGAAGLDYPSVLRSLLAAEDGGPVEVLNAAYPGATGFVLLRVFRDALVQYRPDVLVLSLYFADAHQLTQADEEACYARITAPGYERGPLSWLATLATLRADQARRERLLAQFEEAPGSVEPRWTGPADAGSPPACWEDTLRAFAAVCREQDVGLVLLFEPVADDAPRLWKTEFLDVMRRVGRDEGVPVVDPRLALERSAPRPPFLDLVHPNPLGHRVMALQIAPVVRKLLAARAAR